MKTSRLPMGGTAGLILGLVATLGGGCVLHHHDARTGVDTLYGFGVMRVRTTPVDTRVQTSGTRVETGGLALVWGPDECGLVLGFDRRQRLRIFETPAPLAVNYSAAHFWSAEVEVLPLEGAAPAGPAAAPDFSVPASASSTRSKP
ncbi:MAG TPA: hypothetical protein VIO38_04470 [Rariglobus sp.]